MSDDLQGMLQERPEVEVYACDGCGRELRRATLEGYGRVVLDQSMPLHGAMLVPADRRYCTACIVGTTGEEATDDE